MQRPVTNNLLWLLLIGFGVCGFGFGVLSIASWSSFKRAEGLVSLHPDPDRPNELRLHVSFTRDLGVDGTVPFPLETLPVNARPGDRVPVLYDPNGKSAVVYSFRGVWGAPLAGAVLGFVFTGVGLALRSRMKTAERQYAQTA